MLVPLSWLREYVEINLNTDQLESRLTLAGLEVSTIKRIGDWWDPAKIIIGQIKSVEQHPQASKLSVVKVFYGNDQNLEVVTSAPNLRRYNNSETLPLLKVPLALVGATLVDARKPSEKLQLRPLEFDGVVSNGMICSALELDISEEHEGILFLPEEAPIGTPLHNYYRDQVIELGLTPDMARCLSVIGVAREVASLTQVALRLPTDDLNASGDDQATDYLDVKIDDPLLCHRYVGLVIKDVRIGESPPWMQDRLRKGGMRPRNNIVDITNYVMLEWGQPLHAFDYDVLLQRAQEGGSAKPTITVRKAHSDETIRTLDDKDRMLDDQMLLITDVKGPIAIAGVMGDHATAVTDKTKTILLESATFEGINNRRTAKTLKLESDASKRFTKSIPATLNLIAIRRAAELMRQYAGGRIVPGTVDTYPVPQEQKIVCITQSEVQRQLGMQIDLETIETRLRQLDFSITRISFAEASSLTGNSVFGMRIEPNETILCCTAPWHRLDIQVPADLTEEVARMIGYENVGTTLMADALPPARRDPLLALEEKIRDILAGCGLHETINYALTTPQAHEKLCPNYSDTERPNLTFVTVTNPLSSERVVLRRSMLVSALENLAFNSRFTPNLSCFEIGRVYLPEDGDGVRPLEERRLSIVLTGNRRLVKFHPDPAGLEDFDFFDLKGIIELLFQRLGLSNDSFEFTPQEQSPTFGPRSANIMISGEVQGIFGELHPRVISAFGLPEGRVCVADFEITKLVQPSWRLDVMPAISDYPQVVEDVAFVVQESITVRQLAEVIRGAGGPLLREVELFDVYRGEQVPGGHKSLAYKLTYQSLDRSLSDTDIAVLRETIIKNVANKLGGELRG